MLIPVAVATAQTTVTWTGAVDNSYNNPGNWDLSVVPINDGTNSYKAVIGTGVAVNYDVPDGVGGNNAVTQFEIGAGSTMTLQGRNLVVDDSANVAGKIIATSGSFTAAHVSSTLSGARAMLEVNTSANPTDSANITINASGTYSTTDANVKGSTILTANGSNATLDLRYLQTVDSYVDHWGVNTRTMYATNNGSINLSGVTLFRGGSGVSGGVDSLRVLTTGGGTVDLSNLQQTEGYVIFETDAAGYTLPQLALAGAVTYKPTTAGMSLNLPELVSQNGGGFISMPSAVNISAPKLDTLNNAAVSFTGAGTFNAPVMKNFAGSTLNLDNATQTVTTGVLDQIDNARFLLSNGTTFNQISDADYVITSEAIQNTSVMSAAGTGSSLDAHALTKIDCYVDYWGVNTRTISATNHGSIDLSGVTLLRGGSGVSGGVDSLRVLTTGGGTVDLSNLQQTEGYVTFETDAAGYTLPQLALAGAVTYKPTTAGMSLNLPELVSQNGGGFISMPSAVNISAPKLDTLNNAAVSFTGAGTFNASSLKNFAGSTLTLNDSTQSVTTGGLDQIDNARFILSGGAVFSQIGDTDSVITSSEIQNTTVMSAAGAGTLLDAHTLTKIDSYVDYWGVNTRKIQASDEGFIDLSGATLIRGGSGTSGGKDSVLVLAETGGEIDLSSLTTVNGYTYFEANAGGILRFGNFVMTSSTDVKADGLDSKIAAQGLTLDTSAVVSVTDGAEFDLAGDFQNAMTNTASFSMDTGILRICGAGSALLEVAGQDLGDTTTTGNFGMMQLVIGSETETEMVYLTDIYDNDALGQTDREAMYLFGSGGMDGLEMYGGSTLVLGDVPVYAFLDGSMVELHSLFGPGETVIPFTTSGTNSGYLALPEPATLCLLVCGGLVLVRRRIFRRS